MRNPTRFRTLLKRLYEESTPKELFNFIESNGILTDKKDAPVQDILTIKYEQGTGLVGFGQGLRFSKQAIEFWSI
jgi:hypothetical protein